MTRHTRSLIIENVYDVLPKINVRVIHVHHHTGTRHTCYGQNVTCMTRYQNEHNVSYTLFMSVLN